MSNKTINTTIPKLGLSVWLIIFGVLFHILIITLCLKANALTLNHYKTFDVAHTVGYQPVPSALSAYLKQTNQTITKKQVFCVIGYEMVNSDQSRFKQAWVYWKTGKRLILWLPAYQVGESQETLLHSNRDLDLNTDLVDEKDIQSSTYLIGKQWLKELDTDCSSRGKTYMLTH